jgi:hypothetical protein
VCCFLIRQHDLKTSMAYNCVLKCQISTSLQWGTDWLLFVTFSPFNFCISIRLLDLSVQILHFKKNTHSHITLRDVHQFSLKNQQQTQCFFENSATKNITYLHLMFLNPQFVVILLSTIAFNTNNTRPTYSYSTFMGSDRIWWWIRLITTYNIYLTNFDPTNMTWYKYVKYYMRHLFITSLKWRINFLDFRCFHIWYFTRFI